MAFFPPAGAPNVLDRIFPERAIGGFSRVDPEVLFALKVLSILTEDMIVLDFGAGRGAMADPPGSFAKNLNILRGRCTRVIGLDVDPVVRTNPTLDEAIVVDAGSDLPLPDASVDLIVARSVLEHIDDPRRVASELARVLRPGGWFCASTPSRWGYVAIGARLIPNRLHARVLAPIQAGSRQERDVFPTHYRLNTKKHIRAHFPEREFHDFSYYLSGEPTYNFNSRLFAELLRFYQGVVPAALKKNFHIFLQRKMGPS
jgi:SAM-dependent methyltransferase